MQLRVNIQFYRTHRKFFNIAERTGTNSTFVNDENKLNIRINYMIYLVRFFHRSRIFLVADFNNEKFAFIAAIWFARLNTGATNGSIYSRIRFAINKDAINYLYADTQ